MRFHLSHKISPHVNASAPDGMRLYAIGDIHGRSDLLNKMLELIEKDRHGYEGEATAIFLGDYVDRGPDSKGVAELLIQGLPKDITPIFLKGNHEDLLLKFLDDPGSGLNWLHNGGDRALLSYGLTLEEIGRAYWEEDGLTKSGARFKAVIPASHENFYRSLRLFYRAGGYYFVHAGVRPGIHLDFQDEEDMIWIRKEFLTHKGQFGAVIVHGHTPVRAPEDLDNRIGIDTLAFQSGKLTAVALQGTQRWFLST
jgi:serine/threonine protein phosphatase 1